MKFINPLEWPKPKGYSNCIVASGQMVFIAGTVGWNEKEVFEAPDLVGQARQIFKNIALVLDQAGARPEHIVRMTWYITDKKEYLSTVKELGAAYREVMGRHFPVMAAVVVNGLIEDQAKLEIETTAVIPN